MFPRANTVVEGGVAGASSLCFAAHARALSLVKTGYPLAQCGWGFVLSLSCLLVGLGQFNSPETLFRTLRNMKLCFGFADLFFDPVSLVDSYF